MGSPGIESGAFQLMVHLSKSVKPPSIGSLVMRSRPGSMRKIGFLKVAETSDREKNRRTNLPEQPHSTPGFFWQSLPIQCLATPDGAGTLRVSSAVAAAE